MRAKDFIFSESISYKDTSRGAYSGQIDMTLSAFDNGVEIGYIDYSVYQGEPHVQMIKVKDRRKGYGRALIKKLQSMFPGIEIDFGSLTTDGAALINSLDFEILPNKEALELKQRLDKIDNILSAYSEKWENYCKHPVGEKETILSSLSNWNELHDEKEEIEHKLAFMKPNKRLVKESILVEKGLYHWANYISAFHGGEDGIINFHPWTHFGTERAAKQRLKFKKHNGKLYSVKLNIKNPLKVTDAEASDEASLLNSIVRGKYPDIDPSAARKNGVISACEQAGYDGLVYKNRMEDRGKYSWVIFSPDQVQQNLKEEPITIATATKKNGEIDRNKANKMVDPKGYFHPKMFEK